ncbi:MAG: S-layer homology domain-containing protein, partial [Candidatus Ornithomonoglobus sp.]
EYDISAVSSGSLFSNVNTDTDGELNLIAAYGSERELSGQSCYITLKALENVAADDSVIKITNILIVTENGEIAPEEQQITVRVNNQSDSSYSDGDDTENEAENETESAEVMPTALADSSGRKNSLPAEQTEEVPSELPEKIEPVSSPAPERANSVFEDVIGHWAEESITYLYDNGVVSGVTEALFEPDRAITRAEWCKMIFSLCGMETKQTADIGFYDVDADAWYYPYIIAVADSNIAVGDEGYFRPQDNITREEAAVIAARTFVYCTGNNGEAESDMMFADKNKISSWAYDGVRLMASMDIMNGMEDSRFEPAENTTRAQTAAILTRLAKRIELYN